MWHKSILGERTYDVKTSYVFLTFFPFMRDPMDDFLRGLFRARLKRSFYLTGHCGALLEAFAKLYIVSGAVICVGSVVFHFCASKRGDLTAFMLYA
jgi:hypothetical protein